MDRLSQFQNRSSRSVRLLPVKVPHASVGARTDEESMIELKRLYSLRTVTLVAALKTNKTLTLWCGWGWGGVSWTLLQGWNEVCAQAAGCTLFARQLVLVFIIYHVIYHYLINIYYTIFFGAWTLYTETKPWRQIKQQAVRYHNSKLHPRANLRLLRQVLANASFDDFLLPSCGDVVASLLGWVSSSIWAKFLTENPGNMNRNSGVFL